MSVSVSVVIPAYNAAPYIAEAVDSVLAQTAPAAEVIVLDDGSSDATRNILARYGPRIRLVTQENRGAAAARNRGIELATAPYVAFLDADDCWEPDKLAVQLAAAETHPDLPVVHTDSSVIDAAGEQVRASANRTRQSQNGYVFEDVFLCPIATILTSTLVVRKDCFAVAGRFDARYPVFQDYDLFLRLAWHFPILYIDRSLTRYRLTPRSLTRSNAERNVAERRLILERFVADHADYFTAHPGLLQSKWKQFNLHSALQLFHHGAYAASRFYFARSLRYSPAAWLYGAAAWLPERVLRHVQRVRRTSS